MYILALCIIGHNAAPECRCVFSLHFSQACLNSADSIAKALPEACVVGDWKCVSDVPALQKELEALLNVTPGQVISREECVHQFGRWAKQQRFARADVTLTLRDNNVCDATINFIAATVVETVTLSGTLIGKDKYRHSYVIKPGELFSEELHSAGLQKIKETLRKEGFLGSVVSAEVEHNNDYRTVRIMIRIQQGACYRIDKASMQTQQPLETMDHDQQRVSALVGRLFHKELEKSLYDSAAIGQTMSRIRKVLVEHGFMTPTLKLQEKIDHDVETVELTIHLELGNKNLFIWYGNRFFSRTRLLDQLLNFGSSLTLIPPALLAEELVALYKQYGFWDVHITWREDGNRTYFFISEGHSAIIDGIEVKGITVFSQKKLVKAYGSGLVGVPFNADKVKSFLSNVAEHYVHAGFWDVAIDGYEYVPQEKNHYLLVVNIHEGEQRWLSHVTCDVPCAGLSTLSMSTPKPFDVSFIKEQRQLIIRSLRCEGKLYANPVPELQEETPHHFTLHWRCEGILEPVRFGKTIVVGNGSFDCSHIMRECAYEEGEIWDARKIDLTIARLRSLGIFDVVSLVPDDISLAEPYKDVILQCIPDTSYELRSRLGVQGVNRNIVQWNGGASPKIGLSFLARNPAQTCDLLRLDVDYTRYMHDINLQYRVPWLGPYRVGLEMKAISSRYDQPVYIGSPAVLYRASHDGLMIGCGKNYGSLTGGGSLSVAQIGLKATSCNSCTPESVDCSRSLVIARALDVDVCLLHMTPWYLMLEGTCMIDSRDDKLNPHAGSLTVIALKGVVPPALSHGSFIKGLCEHSWFTSWPYDVVLGLRCRVGMIGGARFDRIMPMERFYLGGPYSLRGYESDYAPPLALFLTCNNSKCLVPTGGTYMVNANLELRVPIYKQLGGVFFIDGGSLSCNPGALVCANNVMGAIGFGLRVSTPVGPLRGDFGWRLHDDRDVCGNVLDSRRFAWFITLGQAF